MLLLTYETAVVSIKMFLVCDPRYMVTTSKQASGRHLMFLLQVGSVIGVRWQHCAAGCRVMSPPVWCNKGDGWRSGFGRRRRRGHVTRRTLEHRL